MSRRLRVAVTIVGVVLGLWFLLAGSQKFLAAALFEKLFADFGLPVGLVPAIGALELAGAVLVAVPLSALVGSALIASIMIGALTCHLLSGVGTPLPALVALAMASFIAISRARARRRETPTHGHVRSEE